MALTFKEATDRTKGIITHREIAKALGKSKQSVAKARVEGPSGRSAPVGWQAAIRELARDRAAELRQHAAVLDELVRELEGE
jgi:hypothetical protein